MSNSETNMRKVQKKGTLKIYLGMSAGVGKTYSMLSDAKNDLDKGVDIVSGYIEPHGRKETVLLSNKIPSLPLWEGVHNGVKFKDLNLDLALERNPDVILIDELAHTNPGGARHKKRYLDVIELLEAGINVRSTLNVQHLESVKDIVENIAGISIYETVPDKILLDAETIEVIDLSSEELISRLKDGKIYSKDKVQLALEKFFLPSKLNALREILLRLVADRIGKDVDDTRMTIGLGKVIKTKERVMVCIAPNAFSSQVVREGRRLATGNHGDFLAISVETPHYANLPPEIRSKSTDSIKLAENLGAKVILKSSLDIVDVIISEAREHHVTQIVLGKPPRKLLFDNFRKSIIDKIIERSGDIGIYLVHTDLNEVKPNNFVKKVVKKSVIGNRSKDILLSIIIVAISSLVAFPISIYFSNIDVVMIYLLATAWTSVYGGKFQSILVSLLSVFVFDFCFVEPLYTIRVSDHKNIITLLVMLFVGIFINNLTSKLRSHAEILTRRENRTATLYNFSRNLSKYNSRAEIAEFLEKTIEMSIGFQAKLFLKNFDEDKNVLKIENRQASEEKNYTLASWCFEHRKKIGKGTEILSSSECTYFPVYSNSDAIGALRLNSLNTDLDLDQEQLIETLCQNAAFAIERNEIENKIEETTILAEKEKVKNAFLSSISHDLRTPLTSIEGAASSLLSTNIYANSPALKGLVISIIEESKRLSRLIGNILNINRLSSDKLELNLEWHSLEEIIGCARRILVSQLKDRKIECSFDPDLPLVHVDGTLIEQLFVNLLENVTKYTPDNSKVVIKTTKISNEVFEIIFYDNGPGMGNSSLNSCVSYQLGHLICRSIVKAHNGSIDFTNISNLGLQIKMQFPIKKPTPLVEYE